MPVINTTPFFLASKDFATLVASRSGVKWYSDMTGEVAAGQINNQEGGGPAITLHANTTAGVEAIDVTNLGESTEASPGAVQFAGAPNHRGFNWKSSPIGNHSSLNSQFNTGSSGTANSGHISVEFFMKAPAAGGLNHRIFTAGNINGATQEINYIIIAILTDGTLLFRSDRVTVTHRWSYQTLAAVDDDVTHHIACIRDADVVANADKCRVYIDGVRDTGGTFVVTGPTENGPNFAPSAICFGGRLNTNNESGNLTVDQFVMYNTILSDAAIAESATFKI